MYQVIYALSLGQQNSTQEGGASTMGKFFDDPRQQARQELLESSEEISGLEEEGDSQEELSLTESFHYLLYQDQPDPEWDEINRKILAGAMPSD